MEDISLEDLSKQFDSTKSELFKIANAIEDRLSLLKEKEQKINKLLEAVNEAIDKVPKKVKLNVGGTLFVTTRETLLSIENTFFHAMLVSEKWKPDEDGEYF